MEPFAWSPCADADRRHRARREIQRLAPDINAADGLDAAGTDAIPISSVSLRVEPGAQGTVVRDALRVIAEADPELMVRSVTTLSAQVAQTTARERLLLNLASGFGVIALLLSPIGLQGHAGILLGGGRGRSACGSRWARHTAKYFGWARSGVAPRFACAARRPSIGARRRIRATIVPVRRATARPAYTDPRMRRPGGGGMVAASIPADAPLPSIRRRPFVISRS